MCYQCITRDRRFIISNQPNLVGPHQPSKDSMRSFVLFCIKIIFLLPLYLLSQKESSLVLCRSSQASVVLIFFLGVPLWNPLFSAWLHERNNVVYLDKEGLIHLPMSKKLVNSPLFNLENNMSHCWEKMAELESEKSRLCHQPWTRLPRKSTHISNLDKLSRPEIVLCVDFWTQWLDESQSPT